MTIPYYIKLLREKPKSNFTGVFNWLMPLSTVIALGAFTKSHLGFMMYAGLFGLLYNLGQLHLFKDQKSRRNGFSVLGSIGTVIILTILTFEWFWKDFFTESYDTTQAAVTIAIFVLLLAVLGYQHFKKSLSAFDPFQYAALMLGLLYLTKSLGVPYSIIFTNLLVAALGLFAIRTGIDKNSFGLLNYGLLIITALIICRFFDTNLDFIFRGILFISVGLGFFFANYLLLKKQRKNTLHSNPESHE